ncbi:MAG: arginase [Flavobacteriaceae bacterium]|nr:arginase [Flavobacteriaceae bacterium]
MKTIKIIKHRSDIGAGTRGADLGIDAIEIAAINVNNDFFNRYNFVDVPTQNESIYDKTISPSALRIKNVYNQCKVLSENVEKTMNQGMFPLVISGDHSSALGTISGIKASEPSKRLGVVWIDAHADIHSPHTSPSGNIHGMPLAAALSEDNMDDKVSDIDSSTKKHWDMMKNIGVDGAKIKAEDLVYFGVRDTETPENNIIAKKSIKNYSVAEMRYRTFGRCLDEAVEKLKDCDTIYISFDVDSMDCDLISKGTGTPVSKGFDPEEILEIMTAFIRTKKVSCLEFVEVNPLLDEKGNVMAETAFDIMNKITPVIESNLV